jgi:DNA-directed RNA polymerase
MAERYASAGRDGRRGFYFPQSCDFRGRVYPTPFMLQIQGDDLQRGLLEFADGKPIKDREAMDAYMSRGAALFGYKRSSLRDRVEWARANTPALLAVAVDPFANRGWLDQDAPWQALGWALDFAGQVKAPGSHVSHLPVAIDHTASGLQLYALLSRDRGLAEATNVAPADAPADLYQVVADDATALLMQETDPMAAQWLQFYGGRVPREAVKRASMTKVYGSTDHAVANFQRDAYEEERIKQGSTPFQELEGGGYRATYYLSQVVLRAMRRRTGAGHATQQWLYSLSDAMTAAGLPLKWTSPSGFPVVQACRTTTSVRIRTAVGDVVRQTRLRQETEALSPERQRRGFAPNFIHSLDAALLALSVIRAQERGVRSIGTVHDCHAVLAADVPVMKRTVRECAADMFSVDLLSRLREELQAQSRGVELPPVPDRGDFDPATVKDSQHFIS